MIPRRTLPPNALVIALSPLLDPRSVGALLDLRARGLDLAVIDVSPVPVHSTSGPRPRRARLRHLDAAARRTPPPPAARRSRRRRVGCDSAAAGDPGGGAGIQALRPARARLITGAAALATLAGAGGYATAAGGRFAALALGATVLALVLLALGARAALARDDPVGDRAHGRRLRRDARRQVGRRRLGRRHRRPAARRGRARILVDRPRCTHPLRAVAARFAVC